MIIAPAALFVVADLPPAPPGLEWLTPQLVQLLEQIPVLGHWITVGFQYVGFVAAVFTAATVLVAAVLQISRWAAWAAGLGALADRIQAFHERVKPYLAYLSIFNVTPRRKE